MWFGRNLRDLGSQHEPNPFSGCCSIAAFTYLQFTRPRSIYRRNHGGLARSNNVNTIADVPSNIVIIDRTEIEQSGANSLESLLRGRAGIQISDSNSGAAFSLRGFSGEQSFK